MQKQVYEFISKQTNDPIVEWKTCRISGIQFPIYKSDLEFYDKISPVFNGKKYQIPTPTLCPEERERRRLAFRNERKLYKRNCDASGKQIITLYSPDKIAKVYDNSVYDSDIRDGINYGKEIDFGKSFFSQIKELLEKVPRKAIFVSKGHENSYYNNYVGNMKNCYLTFDSMESEDCYYGLKVSFSKNCFDCMYTLYSENCYQCKDCVRCYNINYSDLCNNCKNSYFLFNCNNCENCFLCTGLSNKQYYIKNISYTKENYEKEITKYIHNINSNNLNLFRKEAEELHKIYPLKSYFLTNTENCSGNNLENSKNSQYCYDSLEVENCKYSSRLINSKDCYDYESRGDKSTYIYESIAIGSSSHKALFGVCNWSTCTNVMYSFFLSGCSNVFGCVGLKKKQYCIFNKQYTKEEYEKLVPQIIEHMQSTGERGEFFDPSISPFGYNETVAHEYFPLTKEESITKGYRRSDYESPFPQVEGIIQGKDLPSTINEVDDSILTKAIACEITGKPFRIIKAELDFYRKHNIPLPRKHPDQRHKERMDIRSQRKLYPRKCDKCGIEMISVYPQNYEGKVYCESCYNKEIYG